MINIDILKEIGLDKLSEEKEPHKRFHTDEDLQKGQITSDTRFLHYVKRDAEGFHSAWIWSDSKEDLADYLIDVLIARQLFLEEGVEPNNADGVTINNLQESFLLSLASALMRQEADPLFYGDFSNAVSKLSEALDNGSDLNEASIDLMDFTATFFYSITWSFFDNLDEAKKTLLEHGSTLSEDLMESFKNDKNF